MTVAVELEDLEYEADQYFKRRMAIWLIFLLGHLPWEAPKGCMTVRPWPITRGY